jgi:hypothetical protein
MKPRRAMPNSDGQACHQNCILFRVATRQHGHRSCQHDGASGGGSHHQVAREPGIGAFDDPSSGKDMKALGNDLVPVHFHSDWRPRATNACPGVFDDLEANPKVFFHPILEFADH